MSLTPQQLELVQSSWRAVVPIADVAADLFYSKLFELDPDLRSLFPDDMVDQKKKLMNMISAAVKALSNLEELVPAVRSLGRRHAKYFRATPPMYDTVGAALLDTLEKGLGETWTPAHRDAWALVYGILSSTMILAGEDYYDAVNAASSDDGVAEDGEKALDGGSRLDASEYSRPLRGIYEAMYP